MDEKGASLLNGIALAYMGDAIYEVAVREALLDSGLAKPNELQKTAVKYVSAKAQAKIIEKMEKKNFLSEEEKRYFKRGRNAHSKTTAKNTDVQTYRISTGFEAVIGYLYLTGKASRLKEWLDFCLESED